MRKMFLATVVVFVSVVAANAQTATPSYGDVQRTCGAEWRARSDAATNKGREAWQAFLKECTVRKGYVSKRAARVPAGFVPVPDKAAN